MLLVDGVPLGDIVHSREGVEGWDLLLTLLRHPTITSAAKAFRQQSFEQIDAPEEIITPPSPISEHYQIVHQREGGATPSPLFAAFSGTSLPSSEPSPRSREDDQSKTEEPQSVPSTSGVPEPGAKDAPTGGAVEEQRINFGKEPEESREAKGSEMQSTSEAQSSDGSSPTRRVVFVCQRERATVLPAYVDIVGTDEMTTCIAIALRDPDTGRTSIAHIDGEDCIRNGIPAMLLSMEPVNGPLELHLVGGYDDSDEGDDEDPIGGPFDLGENPGDENGPYRSPPPGGSSGRQSLRGARGRSRETPGVVVSKNLDRDERTGSEELLRSEPSDAEIERSKDRVPVGAVSDQALRSERLGQSDEEGLSPSLGKRPRGGNAQETGSPGDESAKAVKVSGDKVWRQSMERRPDSMGKRPLADGFVDDFEARGLEGDAELEYDESLMVSGGQSWPLAAALVAILHRSNVCLDVKTACILWHNTRKVRELGNPAMPAVRGLGIEPQSGRAFPLTFSPSARGPDGVVRGVCMMACNPDSRWQGVLTVPYQTATDTFHVGPCQYEKMDSMARQMQAMDDRDLLLLTSTSPTSEGPEFLPTTRKVLAFLVDNPNWWDVFPFDQPRVFVRTKEGGWRRTA